MANRPAPGSCKWQRNCSWDLKNCLQKVGMCKGLATRLIPVKVKLSLTTAEKAEQSETEETGEKVRDKNEKSEEKPKEFTEKNEKSDSQVMDIKNGKC